MLGLEDSSTLPWKSNRFCLRFQFRFGLVRKTSSSSARFSPEAFVGRIEDFSSKVFNPLLALDSTVAGDCPSKLGFLRYRILLLVIAPALRWSHRNKGGFSFSSKICGAPVWNLEACELSAMAIWYMRWKRYVVEQLLDNWLPKKVSNFGFTRRRKIWTVSSSKKKILKSSRSPMGGSIVLWLSNWREKYQRERASYFLYLLIYFQFNTRPF